MNLKAKEQNPDINNLQQSVSKEMLEVNNVILSNIKSEEITTEKVGQYLLNSPSKRIRPMLTIFFSKVFGYTGNKNIELAAAVEFIHTATLLHDDVIDNSEMRRFQKTVHMIWNNQTSILVGDFLFAQSFKLMVHTGSLPALKSLSEAAAIITRGELSQLIKMQGKCILSEDEYMQIINAKTSTLFAAACESGAIIAEAPDDICQKTKRLGNIFGDTFQIADDILDYFGSNMEIGKNIGDDFNEGKVTLPLIILYQNCDQQEKVIIDNMLQLTNRSEEDFKQVIGLMQKYDISLLLQKKLHTLSQEAKNILNELNISQSHKDSLDGLICYFSNRCN